jgi:hypothetical protein
MAAAWARAPRFGENPEDAASSSLHTDSLDARRSHGPRAIHDLPRFRQWGKCGATFPCLPSHEDVATATAALTVKLVALNRELISLENEASILSNTLTQTEIRPRSNELHSVRGCMFVESCMDRILRENDQRIASAHKLALIPPTNQARFPQLPRVRDAPNLDPDLLRNVFAAFFVKSSLINDQKHLLAIQYAQMYHTWKKSLCPAIFSIHALGGGSIAIKWSDHETHWPTRPFDGPQAAEGVAPDVEQRLQIEETVYDDYLYDGGRVEDPLAAHLRFKRRIAWSEEEKEKFVKVFWLHPRQFGIIAQAFPNRTVHDVVEFYYLTKTFAEMTTARDVYARRHGVKPKRVITEGTVKKRLLTK